MKTTAIYWTPVPFNGWTFLLAAGPGGLCRILQPNQPIQVLEKWVNRHFPSFALLQDDQLLSPYATQLMEYFSGSRYSFDLPLDLRGTNFQLAVWRAVLQIPYGATTNYAALAVEINRPGAVRAVGTANGANPLPIVVPCHRVIGKSGLLTGYRGGLDIKESLLKLEGVGNYRR